MTVVLFARPVKNYAGKRFSIALQVGEIRGSTSNHLSLGQNSYFSHFSTLGFNIGSSTINEIGSLFKEKTLKNHVGEILGKLLLDARLSSNLEFTAIAATGINKEHVNIYPLGFDSSFTLKQQEGYPFALHSALSASSQEVLSGTLGINKQYACDLSLGSNEYRKKITALGISQDAYLLNEIKEGQWRDFSLLTSLVEGLGHQEISFVNAMGFKGEVPILNEIKEGFFKELHRVNSIDFYQNKTLSLFNDISDRISAPFNFVLSVDSAPIFSLKAVRILTAGQDISDKVTECTLTLFGSEVLSDCDVSIKDRDFLPPGDLKVEVESMGFEFLSEEITQDKKNNSARVWGRSKSAKFYEPFAVKKKASCKLGRASEIVSELLSDFELVWEIDDFWVKNLSEEGYPLEIAKRIVEAGGGVLRATPDGRVYAVYAYRKEQPQYTLDLIISATLERKQKEADGVTVVFGDSISHPISIEADKTEVPVGTWVDVKVYSLVPYTFSSTADAFYKAEEEVIEIVEEEITMENGRGTISKPVLEIVEAPPWVRVEGQTVTCDGCRLAAIKYKTKCDVWKVTNYTEGKTLNCSVVTENSVTVLNGSGERVITIEEPLICEPSTARRRAEQELIKRSGYWKASITIPFDSELVDYRGIAVETPWGRGIVVGQSISIESDPLKVLQELEVMLWLQ